MTKHKTKDTSRKSIKRDIMLSEPLFIGEHRIVAYCDHEPHRGLIKNERKYQQCLNRHCKYLRRYNLDERRGR